MPKLKITFQVYMLLFCYAVVAVMAPVIVILRFTLGEGPLWHGILVIVCSVVIFVVAIRMMIQLIFEAKRKNLL